ncbi:ligase-associated DNA damage response exonuclease [Paludisphaera mucosa]|uniref:Ligase-associated DNA damage response exonuclease n=1 Tax=Paludisphaera mucosa TaxID=3030827 RepID=A0ABT6FIN3_9BACT|nr:ligase-associated DNA damage response exonuclease [Paludisphaera mucosa]MDG3007228.1 ligase-associated DNA damage response exonuclease [Paludisphaera mucosa]
MTPDDLLRPTDLGLYCEAGDFYVDPWRPVPRAVITHAHADHACWGCGRYLCSEEGAGVLQVRMGRDAVIDALPFGEALTIQGIRVSLHPAGHILGSAQVRLEHRGRVWVVSGDYKVEPDATCTPFEPVRCDVFVTESTFGLPIYRWPTQGVVFDEINAWWRANRDAGKASLLLGYALGKSQRLLSGLDPSIGPIYTHGAVEKLNRAYREGGVALPPTEYAGAAVRGKSWAGAMIVAPPSAHGTPWARKFAPLSTGIASGWMTIRGTRRRKALDRGFVLSDHVDWPGLLGAIEATGASRVLVTHGYTSVVVRHLREQGLDAEVLATRYEGEGDAQDRAEGEAIDAEAQELEVVVDAVAATDAEEAP